MWVAEAGKIAGAILELTGIAVIALGTLTAFIRAAIELFQRQEFYRDLRQRLGRSVLLGLELLVGADIIRTVTTRPDLQRVFVLALIVLIRTFLSFSLEMELEGKWPWQRQNAHP